MSNIKYYCIKKIISHFVILIIYFYYSVILMTMTSDGSSQNIIVNVNGYHFKFVEVNGDSDCFFHSMLKNQ